MLIAILQIVAGLAILALGGHYIVRGAVAVALLAKVSTAVVGLTVVAFATSLPELAVSVGAALQGSTDIAYANVIGSSIFNVAVILGIAATIRPVLVQLETRRFEHPGMFMVLAACLIFARDRVISRPDGLLLLAGFVVFLTITLMRSLRPATRPRPTAAREVREVEKEAQHVRGWGVALGFVVVGIAGLWAGAELLVDGALTVAETLGVTERIIGLTLVAMGTSIPELATSIVAAHHGEDEIALSNLMGSNIFNILAVLGTTAVIVPVPVDPRAAALDNWVMLGFSAALFPILWTAGHVNRAHGVLLLAGFAAYFGVLILVG